MTVPSVAICVATYKRPDGLRRLMGSLQHLITDGIDVQMIVADNDPAGSGQATFDELAPSLPFPARYVIEPNAGLSHVRNRLVAEATAASAEFLASADDDQTVDPGWVREMVTAIIAHNAAAVAPNLQYAFAPGTSDAIKSCFLNPGAPKPTGAPARTANSGGSLYRLGELNQIDGPFDTRMNASGGEDSLLSLQIKANGGSIICCSTAIITEHMPADRLNFAYVAKRAWREGNIRTQEVRWVNPSRGKSIKHTILFVGYAVKNALMIIPDAIRYRMLPLRRARLMIFGISGVRSMIFGARDIAGYGD